jgi:hypothetical protein
VTGCGVRSGYLMITVRSFGCAQDDVGCCAQDDVGCCARDDVGGVGRRMTRVVLRSG